MKNGRSASKRFLFCFRELKRRKGKFPLVLVWLSDIQDWSLLPERIAGDFGGDIVFKNY